MTGTEEREIGAVSGRVGIYEVETVFPVLSFGSLAWDSKMASYQQFLKHIYWNFMESGISGIGIWLNL